MKNRVLSAALKSTAIVLMLLSAFAIAFPLMHHINGKLYQLENYALTQLRTQTGLSVSYGSLSPAILSGLNLKDIDISDAESDTILLHISSVRVSYRLIPLLRGNIEDAIGSVTVDGLDFSFNEQKNRHVLERILSLIATDENKPDDATSSAEKNGFIIPFPLKIKNCTFIVDARGMSGRLALDSISVKSSSTAPYTTNIETKGNLSFIPDNTLTPIIPKLTTGLKIQARITPDLNGTFGRFELKNADGGSFSFNDVEFVAGMEDNRLSLSMFTPDAPYGVEAWWNLETGAVHAEFNATDFDPFTVVTVKDRKKIAERMTGSVIDGRFSVDGILDTDKENPVSELAYDVDGSVYLPPGIYDGGLDVTAAVRGNLAKVSVEDLQVSAKQFSLNYYGDVDIADLSLSGYLKLGHYLLPSGKRLEGEFYIEDLEHGFSAFSPQVMLGSVPLTAVQLECVSDMSSADFTFEAYDYSHSEADVPGFIALEGSVLYGDEKYLQASLSLENEFLDSILHYVDNAVYEGQGFDSSLYETLSQYILSCDVYGSTDFDSLSFNVPYAVVANTQKDGEMLLLSMDGNETTAQISQFELLYGGQQLSATINADANEDYSQIFFSTDFLFNEMPYSFSAVYDAGKELVINGDYDFELRFDLRVKNQILCSLYMDTIPVRIGDYILSVSLDSDIDFITLEKFMVTFNRFEVTESSGKIHVEPRVEMTGFADNYGLMLETLNYGDSVSILSGNGSVSWILTESALDSIAANIQLDNPIGEESILIDLSCYNPEGTPFSNRDFIKELYVSGSVDVDSFFMSRFLEHQQQEDRISLHGTVLGQLENPFASLEIPQLSLHINGYPLTASLNLMLDDKMLSGNGINLSYDLTHINNCGFDFALEEKNGNGNGTVSLNMDPLYNASSPFRLTLALDEDTDDTENGFNLEKASYEISLLFEDITSNYDTEVKNYEISIRHDEGMWYLSAGTTGGISGYLLDSGEFYLSALADFPITFNADGKISENDLDVSITDINGNLNLLKPMFGDSFSIEDGAFEGNLLVGGNLSDPDFEGNLTVHNMVLLIPDFITEPLVAPVSILMADGDMFTARNVEFFTENAKAYANLTMQMDRWDLNSITVDVKTAENTHVPAKLNISYADCTAEADVNLTVNMTGDDMSVTGGISLYDTVVELHTGGAAETQEDAESYGRMFIDISLNMNQKAELYYPDKKNPLIRGLVTTQEPVRLVMDSDTADINVSGTLVLRGGEILYLNRNFYLREGTLELNESGSDFDPRISFRAELRERDAEGELVKISLSADRQKLSELSPVLSSDPAKTEDEIRMLLGAALVAESGSTPGELLANVAASGFDFLLQNSLFRQVENRLRDLFNFDIFSFRTPFIQQALLSAMNNSEEQASLGNYFDNTTVYIGKYIGNTIYLDALFRFVYQENSSEGNIYRRLAFQPEVGLELPSPFATIRWSIAPDITSAKNLWVPYTSISLSWSFKF
ncbi:MAG: translocation/assembly module TamB domain-containing protein [Treponema sp.]|nr:translocation/assembly module TamB domain-containing protein [Candidatus Treponema caballi]